MISSEIPQTRGLPVTNPSRFREYSTKNLTYSNRRRQLFVMHSVAFHWSISVLYTAIVSFGEVKRATWPRLIYCHLADVCEKDTLYGQDIWCWIDLTVCSHMYMDSDNCLRFSGCFSD